MLYLLTLTLLICSGCAITQTNKNSKYGTSTQGIPLGNMAVEEVKVGMSKNQVIELIGTPPHQNIFDDNTWTYFHMEQGTIRDKKFTLRFKNNHVKSIEFLDVGASH